MTKAIRWAAIAAVIAAAVAPAYAAKGKVAILPARVYRGNKDNGPVIQQALRESLEKTGFEVVPAAEVDRAVSEQKMDLTRPQTVLALGALRAALHVDYVVYPRVLGVGFAPNSEDPQATIIVNVGGASQKAFTHTRQVGQVFMKTRGRDPLGSVIDRAHADEAATKLLEGFYARAK